MHVPVTQGVMDTEVETAQTLTVIKNPKVNSFSAKWTTEFTSQLEFFTGFSNTFNSAHRIRFA